MSQLLGPRCTWALSFLLIALVARGEEADEPLDAGLEDLERVEVQPGPRASLGGGSLAGVIHLQRRRAPSEPTSDVSLSLGSFGLADLRAFGGSRVGRLRIGASGSLVRDDGFRDDAENTEQAGRLALGTELGSSRSVALDLDWSHVEGNWRQPGALTADQIRGD